MGPDAEEELESTRELAEQALQLPAEAAPAAATQHQAGGQQPPEAAQSGAAAVLSITLAYETGWNQVYLHHCVDGQGARRKAHEPMYTAERGVVGHVCRNPQSAPTQPYGKR